jgi:uridine phosphorylase
VTFPSAESLKSRLVSAPERKPQADAQPLDLPQAIHLHPTAALAERVLLPGDPGRALALAQILIAEPRMFNHHRGLWGYSGAARADGAPLTIQSTGMGGPSAAIVISELISLGMRRAVRVGTCGALAPGLALGELVIASGALSLDGASRALGATGEVAADPALTEALLAAGAGARTGAVASVDLFYDTPEQRPGGEALAIEMECATLFALGSSAGIPVGAALVVSDTFSPNDGSRTRIDDHSLLASVERMGTVAVAALA